MASVPRYHNTQQFGGITVVNQEPPLTAIDRFPLKLKLNWIVACSIFQCILGSILTIVGIVNIFAVPYWTSIIAFPIWCGLLILANGIVGCILGSRQTKCLICALLFLSIVSIILTVGMLVCYAIALDYFITFPSFCIRFLGERYCMDTSDVRNASIGLSAFMVFLTVCELVVSFAATALSCQAYCKCCETCDTVDCCTCVGCGECDCQPLHSSQEGQQQAGPYRSGETMQMSTVQTTSQFNANQPNYQPAVNPTFNVQQRDASSNSQWVDRIPYNPCSGLLNIFFNFPGVSQSTEASQGNMGGASGINVTIQPMDGNQQSGQGQSRQQVNVSLHDTQDENGQHTGVFKVA